MLTEKTISDLLLKIYTYPDSGSFYDHILAVLEEYIPAAVTGYSFTNLETGSTERKLAHDTRNGHSIQLAGISAFAKQHPFYECYLTNSMGPVITTADIISEQEWRISDIYQNLHRRYGVLHDTSIRYYIGNLCVSFSFSDAEPIRPEHRRLLNHIAPHLANAHHVYHVRNQGIKEYLPVNMIMLAADGSVIEFSPHAAQVLDKYYPRAVRAACHRLPKPAEQWVGGELRAWSAGRWQVSSANKLIVRSEDSVLTMTLMRHVDVWLVTLEELKTKRPYLLLMEEGLTQRESEILLWIVQGKKNQEIAAILAVSPATIRKHMEHILHKLQCETRGVAAQMAIRILYRQNTGSLPLECLTCARLQCQSCR